MKGKKYFSLISFVLGSLVLIVQIYFTISIVREIKEVFNTSDGDITPSLVAGNVRLLTILSLPIMMGILFGLIGIFKTNRYKTFAKLGIGFSIATILVFVAQIIFIIDI